jgi:dihydroorotate dehydrogenase
MRLYPLVRPLLFRIDPETIHNLTLKCLEFIYQNGGLRFWPLPVDDPCTVMGLQFPNRIGLAAGFDKNGDSIDGLGALGFGFLEVGTVTPNAQPGNPRPRLFRIAEQKAIINKMGFNNLGANHLIANLKKATTPAIIGVNIGKNAKTPLKNAVDDYVECMKTVYEYADYIVVNISSPNTPGLRELQNPSHIRRLLQQIKTEQGRLNDKFSKTVPLVVKLAPDLSDPELLRIAEILLQTKIDGVIATNTTISRKSIKNLSDAKQPGGLSGAPLRQDALRVLKILKKTLKDNIALIASGGIMNAADARERIENGASLVQVYTGLIFEGPGLVNDISRYLKHCNRKPEIRN